MRITDIFLLAYTGLTDRKLRSSLTILGIAIGAAAIIAITAESRGLNEGVVAQINRMGTTTIIIIPSSTLRLTDVDVRELSSIAEIKKVVPFISKIVTVKAGSKVKQATLLGLNLEDLFTILNGLKIKEGTIISPYDTSSIAVGHSIAYGENVPFASIWQTITVIYVDRQSDKITIQEKSFRIQCIFEEYGAAAFLTVDDGVFIPLYAAQVFSSKKHTMMES